MSLLSLPNEILQQIASHLEYESEINSLILTNRFLHSVLDRFLYLNNVKCFEGNALEWATAGGRDATVAKFLAAGAKVDCDPYWNTRKDTQERWAPLLMAAMNGHLKVVELLVDHGADPNYHEARVDRPACHDGHYGQPALLMAARNGHEAVVQLLISKGANPDFVALDNRQTALEVAAQRQHLSIVRTLLGVCQDLYRPEEDKMTLLSRAAREGGLKVVQIMVQMNVLPELNNDVGAYALIHSASQGDMEAIKVLLDAGVDPDFRAVNGTTPLLAAAQRGDETVVELLLERGADPHPRRDDGVTAIFAAADGLHPTVVSLLLRSMDLEERIAKMPGDCHLFFCAAAAFGEESMVQTLLEKGHPINSEQEITLPTRYFYLNRKPLAWAVERGRSNIVKLFLDRGANFDNIIFNSGALIQAVAKDDEELVSMLLDLGLDPNSIDYPGWTPLMYAPSDKMTRLLIARGADPSYISTGGQSALANAVYLNRPSVVRTLLDANRDRKLIAMDDGRLLFHAVSAIGGGADALRVLMEYGLDLQPGDAEAHKVLVTSVNVGNEEALRILLDRGFDVNSRKTVEPDSPTESLLHLAVAGRHDGVTKLLLDRGADAKATTDKGVTPLEFAVTGGHINGVKWLLDHGADTLFVNKEGESPIDVAVGKRDFRDPEVLRLLLNNLDTQGVRYKESISDLPPVVRWFKRKEKGFQAVKLLRQHFWRRAYPMN